MDRRCGATVYSQKEIDRDGDGKKESVYTCVGFEEDMECRSYDGMTTCYWWLRTKGSGDNFLLVGERGGKTSTTYYGKKIFSGHRDADGDEKYYVWGYGVRPAIVIDLNDASGRVISTGRNFADQKTVFEAEESMK